MVRFYICYTNQGIDDHFMLEMSVLRIFKWRREVTLIRPRLEQWGIFIRAEKERDIPADKREREKSGNVRFDQMAGALLSLRKRLQMYGLGATLLSLFLPMKYRNYLTVIEELEHKGRFKQFDWQTHFGMNDAAQTAIGLGTVWGVVGQIMGFLQNRYRFICRPKLAVIPEFGRSVLDTRLVCIFELRMGHIIRAGLREFGRRILEGKEV